MSIRDGRAGDAGEVLELWDRVIQWLVDRGQAHQWGTEPASAKPETVARVQRWITGGGMRIAEIEGAQVGVSVIAGTPPAYVTAADRRETYLLFLVADPAYRGNGVGTRLVQRAIGDASVAGSEILRVDCWADAPELVAWYERHGFVRTETFEVDVRGGWKGQIFELSLV